MLKTDQRTLTGIVLGETDPVRTVSETSYRTISSWIIALTSSQLKSGRSPDGEPETQRRTTPESVAPIPFACAFP